MRRFLEGVARTIDPELYCEFAGRKCPRIKRTIPLVNSVYETCGEAGAKKPVKTKAKRCNHLDKKGHHDCVHFGSVMPSGLCLVHHIESIPPAMRPRMGETT